MIEKLPHVYLKEKFGNLYKLLKVIKDELDSTKSIKEDIEFQDLLNNATNSTLDRHGKLVGQPREYLDDNIYRLLIKSKIRQNLSGGDIPTLNEYFQLVLGNNYLGIKEGWYNAAYDNEPALVVFRYIHDIVEGGITPVSPIKIDGSTLLNGEYSLDGKPVGYFDSEIINFAKSLAKKVIAAGVRIIWEAAITPKTSIKVDHDVLLGSRIHVKTKKINKLNGQLYLDGSHKLNSNRPFVTNDTAFSTSKRIAPVTNSLLNGSLKLDANSQMDGVRDRVNQSGLLKVHENSIVTEEVAI